MSETRYPLLFDTDSVGIATALSGRRFLGSAIGLSVIADERCQEEDIDISEFRGNRRIIKIKNPFLFFDDMHPLIDKNKKRVIGLFSQKSRRVSLYGDIDVKNCRLSVGRYLVYAPYWSVIHECAKNAGISSNLLLVQN